MTDRNVIVRDMIVHRCMALYDVPNNQEDTVRHYYVRFRTENESALDHLEDIAVDLGNPEFEKQLGRLANRFCDYYKRFERR